MIRGVCLMLLTFCTAPACAQSLAERFEVGAKRERMAAVALLEKRIEERKSLLEAAKRGLINQPKNDYVPSTAPDGARLHNFSFRTAADRKEVTARYQKKLTELTRDLKDLKSETAWPCATKSLRELEVGDFLCLGGAYRIALKESERAAWVEVSDRIAPGVFYLSGADFSRYADDKAIDFEGGEVEVLFLVKGTRLRPESLRSGVSSAQTLYELEMISVERLTKELPAGIRVLKITSREAAESEEDLPTPAPLKP